jgi:branched-chain amino acid transport system ATP-binding protein
MGKPLLELRGVSAGYGGQQVLRDVSLEVAEGSLVTLIGPNGHGKTTLLRAVSGLVRPTSGQILFEGQSLAKLEAHQIVERGIVHVPQGDMIFPDMTVFDNLLMGAYLPSANAQVETRLEEIFTLLPRLAERRSQISSTLSGGERRMLGIGRGLMTGGKILMIDEPSLGLAPLLIEQIYQVIANLKASGRTLLLVEENASRVEHLAERVHLLDDGRIVWQGAASELAGNDELLSTYLGG